MLDAPTLLAFRDELRKTGGLPNVGALLGVGGAVGAGLGGLAGGVRDFRAARAQGASGGEAAAHGVLGGVRGAALGAGVGALAGGGAGALIKRELPSLTRGNILGAPARFGQRQVHAVTGNLSPQGLEAIRGGAYDARQSLHDAAGAAQTLRDSGAPAKEIAKATRGVRSAGSSFGAMHDAQEAGLTSVPGVARGLAKDPVGTGKQLVKTQFSGVHPALAAGAIGLPALSLGHTALSAESATGPGRGERIGGDVGRLAGGILTAPLPFVAGGVLGEGLGRGGGAIGRGIDHLRGRRAPASPEIG